MKLDSINYDKKTGEFRLLDKTSNTEYVLPRANMTLYVLVEIFGMNETLAQKAIDDALNPK